MTNETVTEEQEIMDEARDSKDSMTIVARIFVGLLVVLFCATAYLVFATALS